MRLISFTVVLAGALALSSSVLTQSRAQAPAQTPPEKSSQKLVPPKRDTTIPAPPHDLNGIWFPGIGGGGGGGLTQATQPPFTAFGQRQFDANRPASGPREDAVNTNDRYLECDPLGLPRAFEYPWPVEIMTIPGRMIMHFEFNNEWREIWTDGRPLPKDPDPWWFGHSVGKWVDDYTFVVDTVGFNDKTWLDRAGHPHSDQMHFTEVYKHMDRDTISVTFTVDDPKIYTKPWVGKPKIFTARSGPDWELEEANCIVENERKYFDDVTRRSAPTDKSK